MYIRIKRKKTTIFLIVEPTDTVLEVKQKLQALIDKVERAVSCKGGRAQADAVFADA